MRLNDWKLLEVLPRAAYSGVMGAGAVVLSLLQGIAEIPDDQAGLRVVYTDSLGASVLCALFFGLAGIIFWAQGEEARKGVLNQKDADEAYTTTLKRAFRENLPVIIAAIFSIIGIVFGVVMIKTLIEISLYFS